MNGILSHHPSGRVLCRPSALISPSLDNAKNNIVTR